MNEMIMNFSINWSEETLKGMTVGKINIKINFGKNHKMTKFFVGTILNRYKSLLEKSNSYKIMRDHYFSQIKEEYLKMLNKQELLDFISLMDETEIRDLLLEIDNDIFEYYFNILNKGDMTKKYGRTN